MNIFKYQTKCIIIKCIIIILKDKIDVNILLTGFYTVYNFFYLVCLFSFLPK